jgi:hypothetical protein
MTMMFSIGLNDMMSSGRKRVGLQGWWSRKVVKWFAGGIAN